jgi:hypothetical protein
MDAGVDSGGEVVSVPGDLQHRPRTLVEVGGPPAEQWCVERHRGVAVGRVEIAEVPGSGRVRALRAQPPTGLPEPKLRTERVGARGGTASRADVFGWRNKGAAVGRHGRRRRIGVVDGDVGIPFGSSGRRGRDRGDVLTVDGGDEV